MSTQTPSGTVDDLVNQKLPEYKAGSSPYRYAEFAEEIIGVQRTFVQDRILRSLDEHKQTVVVAANGVGKSYIAAAGGLAALYCNPDTIVNVTAGNSGTLKTNIWKPARSLFRNCDALPGRTLDGAREIRTELDDEWFFECVSPRYPDDLEGPHNDHIFYIVEEADKPGVTAEHIDSARSTATDENDRILVISNPPRDKNNVVHELMQSSQWNTLQFSSWDSHNVRVERGLEDDDTPIIPGLVKSSRIRDDWVEFHGEEWPGLEQVIEWSDPTDQSFREDLDDRWYRRRAGVVPPNSASVHRPIETPAVERAYDTLPNREPTATPRGIGYDVARMGGDSNAVVCIFGNKLHVLDTWKGTDHAQNESHLRNILGDGWDATLAIDATGEGSGIGDRVMQWYPNAYRFNAGSDAVDKTEYKDNWAEGLHHLGQVLSRGTYENRRLREELLSATRAVQYTEQYYKSRDATVLKATSKSAIKDTLGRSPDVLDAALMAAWAAETNVSSGPKISRPRSTTPKF